MAQKSIEMPVDANILAEGSPKAYEIEEPASSLKTATIPMYLSQVETDPPASENGSSGVQIKAEGADAEEAQDASLTTDEAQSNPSEDNTNGTERDTPVVLIVEDTTELAEVIQATLERMNIETVHETHGNKAVQKFHETNPDVVLLDISLPDMTGWNILDEVKEKREKIGDKSKMPVVVVITAYGDPANRLVGKLQGIHSYLIKPFTSDEIEKIVTQALESRK